MKEAIRCCIACIFPCGALDVVRVVHASGRVEEISGSVSAGEVMRAYPQHVLRKPPSLSSSDAAAGFCDAVILPPHAELQRGKIYFLVPAAPAVAPEKARSGTTGPRRRRKRKEGEEAGCGGAVTTEKTRLLLNERYLSEILSEKASTARDRRRGRVGVWRPHLESISEL